MWFSKFGLTVKKVALFLLLFLYTINAQIALPTFQGVHTRHPNINYAFSFDGDDDIVFCGDIVNLRTPSYFTVKFWFKRTDDNSGNSNHGINNIMYSKGSDGDNDNIEIGSEGNNL